MLGETGIPLYILIQTVKKRGGRGSSKEISLDTLKKRCAEGELTKEELDRMKRVSSEQTTGKVRKP